MAGRLRRILGKGGFGAARLGLRVFLSAARFVGLVGSLLSGFLLGLLGTLGLVLFEKIAQCGIAAVDFPLRIEKPIGRPDAEELPAEPPGTVARTLSRSRAVAALW